MAVGVNKQLVNEVRLWLRSPPAEEGVDTPTETEVGEGPEPENDMDCVRVYGVIVRPLSGELL